jgi:hypothetical protein
MVQHRIKNDLWKLIKRTFGAAKSTVLFCVISSVPSSEAIALAMVIELA